VKCHVMWEVWCVVGSVVCCGECGVLWGVWCAVGVGCDAFRELLQLLTLTSNDCHDAVEANSLG